ncbi:ribonuclease Z [Mycobacterium kubicae]|uniref:Ribonuclease Z n=1 Tax=Mycobacterium kubicae TaxID=120959 RepID=A0AAX1J9R8_9MYCO|nr:ribonuclease Z [Mycobacterium kubicae]MCV7093855.1 ribonuclease Z [Mycobacterium kubicae]ORW00682.1 ribonuclease Z [Mycobacterium kubicae]QNI10008.1 ribonuclease Z [Mycobacterium kubicae]QPI38211.1 ribonuclease Z [Mycobacterium kubicae]GFG62582.1 ribonuclease Z [Mycobacterium kubicae]
MSVRELIVLGTASQVPTRHRNHNGYLLRWDNEGFLFDPGEGTQRQMLLAGVPVSTVTRLCLTHFHGDHCLGVPGVVQRLSLDGVQHPVHAHFPASGREYFARLHHACLFHDRADLRAEPVVDDGPVATDAFGVLEARALDHSVDAIGYRLVEPDARRFVPELLARFGVAGPMVRELNRSGSLQVGDRTVTVSDVSKLRRGQRFAFVMDTRLCDAVYALADGVDMLVIEATFLHADAELAARYGHLTARQAAQVAADCGIRRLVLTHFSQRYPDTEQHRDEAGAVFDGDLVIAEDLSRIPVPKRTPD